MLTDCMLSHLVTCRTKFSVECVRPHGATIDFLPNTEPHWPSLPTRPSQWAGEGKYRRSSSQVEAAGFGDETDHLLHTHAALEVRHDIGPIAAHAAGVAFHHGEVGADHWCQVRLVDHQQVGACDARAALPRDLLAAGDVDDVDGEVGEFGAEGGRQVVAAGFDQQQLQAGEPPGHVADGGEV